MAQIMTLYARGDLAGAEKHFAAGLEFFDDPGFKRYPGAAAVSTFGYVSLNAWIQGRADVARKRIAQMMVAMNGNNPYDVAMSWLFAALLQANMREYEQAEALAGRALELSKQHQFPFIA